jgi:5-methylcytosine-specific restriction endonuclease McrA
MYATLYQLCKDRELDFSEPAPGHFQIKGQLLVNYYPFSSKRTAYVAGTVRGKHDVSPLEAVEMANRAPAIVPKMDRARRRSKESRGHRQALLDKGVNTCRWCNCEVTINTSTLEHIIPLARGGLDGRNNMTLACQPCNVSRSHDMPELTVVQSPPKFLEAPVELPVVEKPAVLIPREEIPFTPMVFAEDPPIIDYAAVSRLPLIEQKVILQLREADAAGRYMDAEARMMLEKSRKNYWLSAKSKARKELAKVRVYLKLVNIAIHKEEDFAYGTLLKTVAKDMLPPDTYRALMTEHKRRMARENV